MKTLLIYPPQWNPGNPYLSVPLLAGQLKAAGFDVKAKDLNVEFFNRILNSAHLSECLEKAKQDYALLGREISEKYPDARENFNSYPIALQTKFLKFQKLHGLLGENNSGLYRVDYSCGNTARYDNREFVSLDEVIAGVDDAVKTLRSKTDFYDPEKLFDAKMLIQEALKIASLPFAPNELIWDNYFANPVMKMDWENIAEQTTDESVNMFIGFFREYAARIKDENYSLIAISMPDLSQMISVFTLAKILKEETGAVIAIGGNYVTQNKPNFINHPEIFGVYCDCLMTGDGEISMIKLAEAVRDGKTLDSVYGIVFKNENGEIVTGDEAPKLKMNLVAHADFSDYDFSQYYSPEIVLPFQFSKGCYWGKCAFCDYYFGQQCFDIKKVENAVDEMEFYINKYGISHFIFIDEAIPPKYYHELAKEILRRKLHVFYYSFSRLEAGFTDEALRDMYASGCRILMWGYECSEPRLMEMMNKGINPGTRLDIMRSSHNAGIWNNALFIIGYPTETMEEIDRTLAVIKDNRDIINSCTPSNFALKKNAIISQKMIEKGELKGEVNGEFYTVYKDSIDGISQQERREVRRKFHADFITENRHCLWPVNYSDFDHTLLYLARYGEKFVSNYRSYRNICPMFR